MPPNLRHRVAASGPFGPQPHVVFPTLSGLSAAATPPYPAGALAWVESLRRMFLLDRSATDAPIAGQLVAAPGGGLWRALQPWLPSTNPWKDRTEWHVNPATGSLEGEGSAADPISTFAELQARLEGRTITEAMTVYIEGNLAEICDLRSLRMSAQPAAIIATGELATTIHHTDVVATYTAESNAANEQCLLTAVGIADWTPYKGYRIRFLDGPAQDDVSWIATEDPAGAGVDVARITRPNHITGGDYFLDNPAPGNTFVLESLPTVQAIWLPEQVPAASDSVVPAARSLEIAGIDWLPIVGRGFVLGCKASANVFPTKYGEVRYCGTCFEGYVSDGQSGYRVYRATLHRAPLLLSGAGNVVFEEALVQGSYISCGAQDLLIKGLGIFDSTTHGMWAVGRCTSCYIQGGGGVAGGLRGTGNAEYGINVEEAGSLWSYAIKPVITGTSGDTRFAGTARLYAAVPFFDNVKLTALAAT